MSRIRRISGPGLRVVTRCHQWPGVPVPKITTEQRRAPFTIAVPCSPLLPPAHCYCPLLTVAAPCSLLLPPACCVLKSVKHWKGRKALRSASVVLLLAQRLCLFRVKDLQQLIDDTGWGGEEHFSPQNPALASFRTTCRDESLAATKGKGKGCKWGLRGQLA